MDHLHFTRRSITRMQQRGINRRMVAIALAWGERHESHGAYCYSLTDRSLRDTEHAEEVDRLRGLSIVVSPDNHVITAKWSFRLRRSGMLRRSAQKSRRNLAELTWASDEN